MPIAQLEELLRRAIAVVGEARLAQDRILKRDGKGGVRAAHAGSDLGVHVLRLRKGIQQPVRLSGEKLAPALKALLSGKETCLGDRKSVVSGKSVSVRVDLGGRRSIKKKKT